MMCINDQLVLRPHALLHCVLAQIIHLSQPVAVAVALACLRAWSTSKQDTEKMGKVGGTPGTSVYKLK